MRGWGRKIEILARGPGPISRISEPVTGRQERSNSSTRSHDSITDIWKEIRHDYLEETSGCACLGARRDCASIAKLRAGSRPRHQRERSYDSLGATDPTGAVGKPDSGPALGSRAGTHSAHCQQSDLWRLRLGTKLPLLW